MIAVKNLMTQVLLQNRLAILMVTKVRFKYKKRQALNLKEFL